MPLQNSPIPLRPNQRIHTTAPTLRKGKSLSDRLIEARDDHTLAHEREVRKKESCGREVGIGIAFFHEDTVESIERFTTPFKPKYDDEDDIADAATNEKNADNGANTKITPPAPEPTVTNDVPAPAASDHHAATTIPTIPSLISPVKPSRTLPAGEERAKIGLRKKLSREIEEAREEDRVREEELFKEKMEALTTVDHDSVKSSDEVNDPFSTTASRGSVTPSSAFFEVATIHIDNENSESVYTPPESAFTDRDETMAQMAKEMAAIREAKKLKLQGFPLDEDISFTPKQTVEARIMHETNHAPGRNIFDPTNPIPPKPLPIDTPIEANGPAFTGQSTDKWSYLPDTAKVLASKILRVSEMGSFWGDEKDETKDNGKVEDGRAIVVDERDGKPPADKTKKT
ncbi:hypothetical protein L202_06636 [Cryptococcus amylolentus CBS 6039]|uniref:Uncharacterized protein n=2 Tax=Cryptococcus amylolentus TaxID=104669 RepID=A0A1E3HGN7_9TREE|nr:hypothetical protein L202_06636 [Cryptococcus amylolentus CBS 6039]ODN75508.1 hypothetical protein L202_06636 [Cryptococcus amylolentus CBS 6039]ODO03217.1 hypothetical protein I350_06062 [Cryptococcus amylolentus CBS 6273]